MFSSLDLEHDRALAAKLGPSARAGTPRQAAAFAKVLMISVPYGALPQVGKELGALLRGKVVIDTCNPLEPGRVGMPVASDDAEAVKIVSPLIRDIGYVPVLVGPEIGGEKQKGRGAPPFPRSLRVPKRYRGARYPC